MAKPQIPNQKKAYNALNTRLDQYVARVQSIYDKLNQQAATIAQATGYQGGVPFRFSDYPEVTKMVNDLLGDFVGGLQNLIYAGTSDEWKQSNIMQDLLAKKVMRYYDAQIDGERQRVYYQSNSDALKAFQQRTERGMNLSTKLWDQSGNYKQELEYAISAAIEKGTSAVTLSKRLSQYLNDFPSMKADYTDLFGHAVECYDCEYRSIRLARSEINMAYRTAEQTRWRQFDFIVGYEIKLSGSHPAEDICDALAGRYPKDFVWTGWHPNDMCYSVPIVMSEDDYWKMREGEDVDPANQVEDVPGNFKEWVSENADKIAKARERGTLPYFIKDNKTYVGGEALQGSHTINSIKSIINHITFKEDAMGEQQATAFTIAQIENHKEVSKAIKLEQGDRMSFKDADSGKSNPNFSWFDALMGIESEYNTNCTLAVVTHELRMRGWDVTALALNKRNKVMNCMWNGAFNEIWIDPKTGEAPKVDPIWAKTIEKTSARFEKATKEVGRYHISVHWKGRGGHVFCVDRLPDGNLRVYDPQNNQLNITDWMEDINLKKGIGVLRVDGMLINADMVRQIVKPR